MFPCWYLKGKCGFHWNLWISCGFRLGNPLKSADFLTKNAWVSDLSSSMVFLRVRSHWASNFASASACNSQMQTQSYSLNCISNPFYLNCKLSRKFSHKVNHNVSAQFQWTLLKWVWYLIERGTLHLCLRVTRSVWTDPKEDSMRRQNTDLRMTFNRNLSRKGQGWSAVFSFILERSYILSHFLFR